MINQFAESAVRFFFLLSLNETQAAYYSKLALREIKKNEWLRKLKLKNEQKSERVEFLHACLRVFLRNQTEILDHREISFGESNLLKLPKRLNLGPWQSYLQEAPQVELLTVLFLHALNASREETQSVLKISEGTLITRVQNSTRRVSLHLRGDRQ